MKQLFYRIIYQANVNYILRNFNKFLYPILPEKLRLSPSGRIKVKISDSNTATFRTNQTNFITFILFWKKTSEFEYTRIFIPLIKKVDCFIDVGANIGFYSILAAKENKNIKVISFEPAIGSRSYLSKNVEENQIKNISIEAIALADISGQIEFFEIKNEKYPFLDYNLSGTNGTQNVKDKKMKSYMVDSVRFDQYTKDKDFKSIDLIKLDTEGTENIILENSRETLSKYQPIVICETLYNTIESEIETIMFELGYQAYNHTPEGLLKVDTITRDYDNGVRDCFFVPPSKLHLIEEFVVK